MDKFDKITKIKFSVFIIYYLSFFLPIYSQKLLGSIFKVSISELSAGTFFLVFFAVIILVTVFLKFLYEKYFNYAYFATIGFMIILFLILLFFKESLSTLRMMWYVQFILIGILVFAHFKEELTVKVFDKIVFKSKEYMKKLIVLIKDQNEQRKEKKSRKASINQEEIIPEGESA